MRFLEQRRGGKRIWAVFVPTEFSIFSRENSFDLFGRTRFSDSGFLLVNWALPCLGFLRSSGSSKVLGLGIQIDVLVSTRCRSCHLNFRKVISFIWLWKWRRKIMVKGAILKHRSLIFSYSGETGSDSDASEAKSLESPTNSAAVFAGKLLPGSIAVSSRLWIRKIRIFKLIASPGILMGPCTGLP